MTREELAKALSIRLESGCASNDPANNQTRVYVTLLLDGEEISTSYVDLEEGRA